MIRSVLGPLEDQIGLKFPPEGSIINQPREKDLKGTKSWACNTILKAYHASSKENPLSDLIAKVKPLLPENFRLADSGYLTFVDLQKAQAEIPVIK